MDLFNKEVDLLSLSYEEVKDIAAKCQKCPLSKTRTNVVFGHGPVPCDLMLIGEAPGADEDEQGLPFVGRSGKLLTQILESIGIKRPDNIYIANTLKCRPPENRAPLASEQEACWPYLEAQLNLIKPKILLLAGTPSVKNVLKINEPISKIRGKWFKLEGYLPAGKAGPDLSVMPIFHPSYLLRNPQKTKGSPKWLTWQDMIEVKNALDYLKKVRELSLESKE